MRGTFWRWTTIICMVAFTSYVLAPPARAQEEPSCGAVGGDYCSQSGACPSGFSSLGVTYDCNPCCKSDPPPDPGPSCGELGGTYCSQSGSCPANHDSLGGTYDCSPCCRERGPGNVTTYSNVTPSANAVDSYGYGESDNPSALITVTITYEDEAGNVVGTASQSGYSAVARSDSAPITSGGEVQVNGWGFLKIFITIAVVVAGVLFLKKKYKSGGGVTCYTNPSVNAENKCEYSASCLGTHDCSFSTTYSRDKNLDGTCPTAVQKRYIWSGIVVGGGIINPRCEGTRFETAASCACR